MRWRDRLRAEGGSATAEFAIVLPAVVLLLVLVLSAISAQGKRVLMQDAAADAARLVARFDSAERASALVNEILPGASISTQERGDLVCATITLSAIVVVPVQLSAQSCALAGGS